MKQGPSTTCAILLTLLMLFQPTAHAADGWTDLELEGDQLLISGQFSQAAEKYNQSAQLALEAGEDLAASKVLAKLGRCFAKDKLNNSDLLAKYLAEASDLASGLAEKEADPAKRGDLYLDSASYAAEAGLSPRFLSLINSSAFSYLEAAEGKDLAAASTHMRKAGYLLQFNNFSEGAEYAFGRYRGLVLEEVDRVASEARDAQLIGLWEDAGRRYYDAALRSYEVQGPAASDLFGMAAQSLAKAAESISPEGEPGAANLSRRAQLYRLAAISAEFNASDGGELYRRAGDSFSQAAARLLESRNLSDGLGNLSQAGLMYAKSGMLELSKEMYVQAARTAEELASSNPARSHAFELEAGMAYDSAGLYREAAAAYYRSLGDFTNAVGVSSYMWPWQEFEFLQILGRSRRSADSRAFSGYVSSPISFFGGPAFGGYDLMGQLGPAIALRAKAGLAYDCYVTDMLLLATSVLLNGQPLVARSLLEEVSGGAIAMDPPRKALYDYLSAVINAQQEGQARWSSELALAHDALQLVYFEDLSLALAGSLANALSSVLSGELTAQLFLQRCRGIAAFALEDLRDAAGYNQTIEDYLSEGQKLSAQLMESKVRNAAEHLKVVPFWGTAAKRSSFQGKLNDSAGYYERASYHACAGEDYQAAILYHDLSWGCLGFRTPTTAAVYAIANAMLDANQTLKDQARAFILGNLSGYIPQHEVSVLLSVLEGRTELETRSSLLTALAIALIGGFVLLTSYVLLIWEQKHPARRSGGAKTPAQPAAEEEQGETEAEDEASKGVETPSGEGDGSEEGAGNQTP